MYLAITSGIGYKVSAAKLAPTMYLSVVADLITECNNRYGIKGPDYVQGVVRINAEPSIAVVALYRNRDKICLAQRATEADGSFRFSNLPVDDQYFVVAFDPVTGEKAEVYDRI